MKDTARKYYKTKRRTLTKEQRTIFSQQAVTHLLNSPLWQKAQTVLAYLALPDELSLDSLYEAGWQMGKTMVIPISQPDDHSLLLSRLEKFSHLTEGAYHIRELAPPLRQKISAGQIDLCLIPGIAFDKLGNRLGFGAGYYDRFLPRLRPDVPKIGVCFSAQLSIEPLPTDEYDKPMDYLLTENGLTTF